MILKIADPLKGIVCLGWARFLVQPSTDAAAAQAALTKIAAEWRVRAGEMAPSQIPAVQQTRQLYKALGLDPTKHRPSSEALLRRALKEKPLPRVHPVVDALNAASLQTQVSMGLYDLDQVQGDAVEARIGEEGEQYEGIGRGAIHVQGRICLVDAKGPFGNPTADSDRTKVGSATKAVGVVTFQSFEIKPSQRREVLDQVIALLEETARCVLQESALIPPS